MDQNLEYLLREYTERITYLTEGLARGNVPTMEEYRYVCGQLRGLEAACLTVIDLKQRMENSDE